MTVLHLETGLKVIDRAFRIAVGDLLGNIVPYKNGLLTEAKPCIMAGLDYNTPWTRDASFNTWYGGGLVVPEAARNTLLSVLTRDEYGLRIGGEYWDAIIWSTGAWQYYLYTDNKEFLATALEATHNSLNYFEQTEFDSNDGLFRGGACFQDGVAAYPDTFSGFPYYSGIYDWVKYHPDKKVKVGYGLPMKALSTNCLYFNAYQTAVKMAEELHQPVMPEWGNKAEVLKSAINHNFWNPETGSYRYLLDAPDTQERQEGFGHAFAILFGVANPDQAAKVFASQYMTAHGIPCVWPQYERYASQDGTAFGRHCGTIWPQVNAAWAAAAAYNGRPDLALFELLSLAQKANRDKHFAEIYHPLTGEIYGGMQEALDKGRIISWEACSRQTWCATGYLYMVLTLLFGMRFTPEGILLAPYLPEGTDHLRITGLRFRNAILNIEVKRDSILKVVLNGAPQEKAFIPANMPGEISLQIHLA